MAAAKKTWKSFNISRDNFIAEGDIREILDITAPTQVVDDNGVVIDRSAAFVVAGPKGGSFTMRIPAWYWAEISNAVDSGQLHVGCGLDDGGWKLGKFLRPSYYAR